MTRFGMKEADFEEFAPLMAEIVHGREIASKVSNFRSRFTEMRYCFSGEAAGQITRDILEVLGLA